MAEEKKIVAPAATEVKAEAPKAEVKKAAPAKKAAAKKAAPAKKAAAKTAAKAPAKKAAAKKPAAKKASAKKAAPAKIVEPKKFIIQNSADQSISYTDIVKKVNKAYKDTIKSLEIYVKSEENKAYYVVNGGVTGSVDLY
ncbi:MAG: DUF6465 family protein [Saccharofermentans sp.]|nr:DUF6465 family protein [Saccharofermentans sp.]